MARKTFTTETLASADLNAALDWAAFEAHPSKANVRVASTASITLPTGAENGDTIDGVTLATGDRLLLKNQANAYENGIYVVAATGAPARAGDADTDDKVNSGVECYVEEGSTNGGKKFKLATTGVIILNTTDLSFTELSGGGDGSSIEWEGQWVTATAYQIDDIVQNGDTVSSYRAKTNHTSGTTSEPGVGASWEDEWEIIAEAGGQGPQGEPGLAGGSLDWKGDWVNATAYDVDDAVQDGTRKSSYRCKSAHTSGSTTRPGLGASWTTYWTLIAQAGEAGAAGAAGATGATGAAGLNGVVWQGAWNSVSAYAENDAVSHNGSSYVCTDGNTNQEPPNGTYWDLLAAEGDVGPEGPAGGGLEWLGDWETAAGYAVNDAVQNGSPKSSYRCHAAHTAATDNEPGVGVDWEDFWILVAGAGGSAVESLGDLSDVVITSPVADQVLKHNGTNWINGAAPSAGHIIADEGTPLTARATLDFVGAGVIVTDNGSSATVVTIPGGGGGLGVAGTVEAHVTGTQSISNATATAVSFNTTATDPADYWDVGTPTKLIVPAGYGGWHQLVANVEFAPNSTSWRRVYFRINGTDIYGVVNYNAATTGDTNVLATHSLELADGDEIEVMVEQNSGGSLNIQPYTGINVTRLAVVDEINATQIQGRDVAATAPADGQVLAWNNTASEYQPVDQSGGGGGSVNILDVWVLT